jgi:hypothetical protein
MDNVFDLKYTTKMNDSNEFKNYQLSINFAR